MVEYSKIHTNFREALRDNNVTECSLCGRKNVKGEVCHRGSGGVTTQKQILKAFELGLLEYIGKEKDKKKIAHYIADMPLLMTLPGCRSCNEKVSKNIEYIDKQIIKASIEVYESDLFRCIIEAVPFIERYVNNIYIYSLFNNIETIKDIILVSQNKLNDILEATVNTKKLKEIRL